jgi:GAF domain-containing protein
MPSASARPHQPPFGAFAARLRDLLSTVETTTLLVASEARVRGLGEHLRFACLALPCSEALVALEIEALGRLVVPAVAGPNAWRAADLQFQPGGTPFAYLLSGGGGHAAELTDDDAMIAALRPILAETPRSGIFVPIRLGDSTIGGAALLSHDEPLGDHHLDMGERLAEVLALTVESFRTERVVFELFARALPELLAEGATTSLRAALQRFIHTIRVTPEYRRRLELAIAIGRVADRGEAETRLAAEILMRIDAYARTQEGASVHDDGGIDVSGLTGGEELL